MTEIEGEAETADQQLQIGTTPSPEIDTSQQQALMAYIMYVDESMYSFESANGTDIIKPLNFPETLPEVLMEIVITSYSIHYTKLYDKRAVGNGQKALIIDDFMKGGGSAKGLMDMMKEFSITVAGVGVVIATKYPEAKRVKEYKSLMELHNVDEINRKVDVRPSEWI